MSATSKLVGFSSTAGQEGDEAGQRVDLERRRYLMRYVIGALGVAGVICVAAGVRVVMARSASPQDDAIPTLLSHPISMNPPPAALPAQAEPQPVVVPAPVEAPPVAALPAAVAPVAAAVAAPQAVAAPVSAAPVAAAPVSAAAARAPAKSLAAPAANAAPAHARAPAAAPRPQSHASAIIQSAPF
jgi:hypothetical protein